MVHVFQLKGAVMQQIRPNITMPEDLWKELQEHVEKLKSRGEEGSASSIIRRLVREYLKNVKSKGGKRK
jgi:metal-responsive CopG/Arc/MetJ family transcriptional regulator